MKIRYRGKDYDSEELLEITSIRDMGAYILLKYPSVSPNRMFLDKGFDNIAVLFLYTPDEKLTRDPIIHMPPKSYMMRPEFFHEFEKRVEKILIKRGFI